ncbi:MAG: hypothetical protein Q8O16_07310 [Dehalococcoidia bacterium]|nr:hypothetical protein [Dehalococcoidia bacterium]
MRRGCISLGNIKCDECKRTILYPERYLAIQEDSINRTLCKDCCLSKGLAKEESSKDGRDTTFLLGD